MRIDHVMIVTLDPDREIRALRDIGFGTGSRGRFDDGVVNWVVPMPSGQYLEVVAIDEENPGGAGAVWLREHVAAGRRFAGWGVEVPSVDNVATRLGRLVEKGARIDGEDGPWRHVDAPPQQSFLPFFITYRWTGDPEPDQRAWRQPWVAAAKHDVMPLEIAGLDLVGDAGELRHWLGGELPLTVTPGAPARLSAIRVRTPDGEVVLRELH